MKLLRYLYRGLNLLFTSLNFVVGIIVGAVFGLAASFLILASIDGYSLSGQWAWHLLPGTILGAYAGIKFWPLMLGLFIGGDADASDASVFDSIDLGSSGNDVPDGESGANSKSNRGAW